MRWVVHGTDAVTGEPVSLGVNKGGATDAVQAAIRRRMIVERVTGRRWVAAGVAAGLLSAGVIGLMGTMLWQQRGSARRDAATGWTEVARLRAVVADNETIMRRMEERGESRASIAALDAATQRATVLEGQLAMALAEAGGRKAADAKVAALEGELQSVQANQAALTTALQEKLAEAKATAEKTRQAEEQLAALAAEKKAAVAQMDALKGELLAAVAKPSDPESTVQEEPPALQRPARWALKTSYGTASEFIALRFEKDSMTTTLAGNGELEWTATAPANAARVRVLYDKAKDRVFGANLSVGLAADGPASKIALNRELVQEFLKAFAPAVKEEWVNRAVATLIGRDSGERMVVIAEDAKVSVWNNGEGLYTWKVESVGNEME